MIRQAAELARLLSLPPGDLALPSDLLRQQGRWDLSLKQTIDQALALREEIKASLAESDHFGWSAKAISNQVLPSFWLQASSGLEGDRYAQRSTTKSGRGMSISRTQDAGLYFNWPIEDGGISAALATAGSIAQLYRYSARWPETALPLLQRRVESLRRQEG